MEDASTFNFVLAKQPVALKLLPSKDESLLVWWNFYLFLNPGFEVFNGVQVPNPHFVGFACQGLYKNLHATS